MIPITDTAALLSTICSVRCMGGFYLFIFCLEDKKIFSPQPIGLYTQRYRMMSPLSNLTSGREPFCTKAEEGDPSKNKNSIEFVIPEKKRERSYFFF